MKLHLLMVPSEHFFPRYISPYQLSTKFLWMCFSDYDATSLWTDMCNKFWELGKSRYLMRDATERIHTRKELSQISDCTFLLAHNNCIVVYLHRFFCTLLCLLQTISTKRNSWIPSLVFFSLFSRHCTWYFTQRSVNIQASFRQLWSFCIGNEHLIPRSHETTHPYRSNMVFKKILCPESHKTKQLRDLCNSRAELNTLNKVSLCQQHFGEVPSCRMSVRLQANLCNSLTRDLHVIKW